MVGSVSIVVCLVELRNQLVVLHLAVPEVRVVEDKANVLRDNLVNISA
jgi:hypothetical protein